jgi:hypothetical protein
MGYDGLRSPIWTGGSTGLFGQNTYGPIIAKGPLTIEYGRSLRRSAVGLAARSVPSGRWVGWLVRFLPPFWGWPARGVPPARCPVTV